MIQSLTSSFQKYSFTSKQRSAVLESMVKIKIERERRPYCIHIYDEDCTTNIYLSIPLGLNPLIYSLKT